MNPQNHSSAWHRLRLILLAILLFGFIGLGVELLLLEHTEGIWQKIPLGLIAAGTVTALLLIAVPRRGVVRTFQTVMWLTLAGGLIGLYLHYDGNLEFEREISPSFTGLELFKAAMMGATPTLAPGTLIQFGLLGLACTFRHPALSKKANSQPSTQHEDQPT